MSALTPVPTPSRLARAWELASDVVIATALLWTVPLLLGLATALVRMLTR